MRLAIARRDFLRSATACTTIGAAMNAARCDDPAAKFELSLVESSLKRSLAERTINHLDLAKVAKSEFGLSAVEYGSQFFQFGKSEEKYLEQMNRRAAEHGVRQLMIVVDGDGRIGDAEAGKRRASLQRHRRWVDVAKALGCHSIQVNAESTGDAKEQLQRAVSGLGELCNHAAKQAVNVLVGTYGGLSAKASWVKQVVESVDHSCCRALLHIRKLKSDDDYRELSTLVPLAKGVTATASEFDERGNAEDADYSRAMSAIQKAGYHGYVGICYCGTRLDEKAGVKAMKSLLDRIRTETEPHVGT